jgi:hypothetical protein
MLNERENKIVRNTRQARNKPAHIREIYISYTANPSSTGLHGLYNAFASGQAEYPGNEEAAWWR